MKERSIIAWFSMILVALLLIIAPKVAYLPLIVLCGYLIYFCASMALSIGRDFAKGEVNGPAAIFSGANLIAFWLFIIHLLTNLMLLMLNAILFCS